ncbi:hypothetical protein K8O68_15330 [Salipaludibacillus sp. CUR1]|uniref:hypothetical protein n=1 Tax=Salipaludibacillus sp. CUR1 TaxID=2820003 RepID=UPI001E3564F9|nr:hypothetical protein [Salipaludibacillus sp. CUR1]MCE7793795.1 hypothetical protein [Salipaludibacillus sp. CUR1]
MKIPFFITGALVLLAGCFTDYEEEHMAEHTGVHYGVEYTADEQLDARLVIDNQSEYDVFVGTGTRDDLGGISLYQDGELLVTEPDGAVNDNMETIRVNAGERETGASISYDIEPGVTYIITGQPLLTLSIIDGDVNNPEQVIAPGDGAENEAEVTLND